MPLLHGRCVYFLALKRLVNKNFYHVIFFFKEIKRKTVLVKVLPSICKSSFLNSSNFFLQNFFLKIYKKFLKRSMYRRIQNLVEHLRWKCWENSKWPLAVHHFSKKVYLQLGSEYASGISSLLWMKSFAIALMLNSSNFLINCQNDL